MMFPNVSFDEPATSDVPSSPIFPEATSAFTLRFTSRDPSMAPASIASRYNALTRLMNRLLKLGTRDMFATIPCNL